MAGFNKKFADGDILALADDYERIDKDKYGLICVDDANRFVMFYIVMTVDCKGRVPMDFRDVEEHYEKIGECTPGSIDELLFTGHITFKEKEST